MKQSDRAQHRQTEFGSQGTFPDILTVEECACYLGISKLSMYRLIRKKGVPVKRVAGAFKVSRRQVLEWFESL